MTEPDAVSAELLEASAAGYATAAASALVDGDPGIRSRFGPGALMSWKAQFVQRLLELAAAVRVGEPGLFAGRLVWQKKAFMARGFDPDDLIRGFESLRRALSSELPEQALRSVEPYLEQAAAALAAPGEPDASELDPDDAWAALALEYLAACLEGDPRRAIDLVLNAREERGSSAERLSSRVLLPAQREVGRMWHAGEAGVAEERVVTETTRRLMTLLCHGQAPAAATGKSVLGAAVAGNAHEVGIRAVVDHFELAGWRAICLGADVPAEEIAAAARFFDVDLVVLAATLTTQLNALRGTLDALRQSRGNEVKILVGGLAFAEAPELWRDLGADGYAADALDALEAGARLVGLES